MRKVILTLSVAFLAVLGLEARPGRQLTRPTIPSAELLQRLGLKKRWHVYLPVEGSRDGVALAEVVDSQFVAQTFGGSLVALDAETGRTQWRTRLDQAYGAQMEQVAHNNRMFFVAANARLYGVDRSTGNADWSYDLPGILAVAPATDVDRLYICTAQGRVFGYLLPVSQSEQRGKESTYGYGAGARDKSINPTTLTRPEPVWQFQLESAILQPPIVFGTHVVFADGKGTLFSFQKDERSLADVIKSPTPISAPLSKQDDLLYVASEDHSVYCYQLEAGTLRPLWTYAAGHRARQKPMVIGDDVFVAVEAGGLHCIDKSTGLRRWVQPQASRFLGASLRLICAGDPRGRTLVLDRQKGTVVGMWDTGDFAVQVENDVSNRIFLANHDGLVICLQDLDPREDQATYYRAETKKEEGKPAPPAAAEEKPKEDEKKDKMDGKKNNKDEADKKPN